VIKKFQRKILRKKYFERRKEKKFDDKKFKP